MKHTAIVILAAGTSSRMGQPKQLLKIGDKTMLRRSVEAALDTQAKHVLVVVGAFSDAITDELKAFPEINTLVHADYGLGIGGSLKAGVSNVMLLWPDTDGILVMTCDQPMVSGSFLQELIHQYETPASGIVASRYAGTFGVPALLDGVYFKDVLQLPDSQGAKKILQANEASLLLIDFPGGEIDLDTPEDFRNFTEV